MIVHRHGRVRATIESRCPDNTTDTWLDSRFSMDMLEQATTVEIILKFGMTSRCIGHVVENQDDDEMKCDVAHERP